MSTFEYFTDAEVKDLDKDFVGLLDQARHISMVPYIITSGYRPGGVDGVDNGVKNSSHMQRVAVDLRCQDSQTRYKILKGLFSVGFNRIGLGSPRSPHIHVDMSSTLPQGVFWLED